MFKFRSKYFSFTNTSIVQWQDGGVISRLYNSDLRNIDIKFPNEKNEKYKFSVCHLSLHALIRAKSEKIEQLQQH